jgi:predicted DNA-binding transcriptional regulator AlpA
MSDLPEHPDVVGAVEIAARLGVKRATVDAWRQRGQFPSPAWSVGGRPAWDWAVIEQWERDRTVYLY